MFHKTTRYNFASKIWIQVKNIDWLRATMDYFAKIEYSFVPTKSSCEGLFFLQFQTQWNIRIDARHNNFLLNIEFLVPGSSNLSIWCFFTCSLRFFSHFLKDHTLVSKLLKVGGKYLPSLLFFLSLVLTKWCIMVFWKRVKVVNGAVDCWYMKEYLKCAIIVTIIKHDHSSYSDKRSDSAG